MNWRFAYSIGFHPWEDAVTDPPFVEKASELFGREEQGREPHFRPPKVLELLLKPDEHWYRLRRA
jgi:hypothetical protein